MANLAALCAAFFSLSAKTLGGGVISPPAVRGLKTAPLVAFPANPYGWSKSAEHDVTLTTRLVPRSQKDPRSWVRPGFGSKVCDLDGPWTFYVVFIVGLWKPRTSKLCYAARPWKPRTSRFRYAARPWKPRTSTF